MYPVTADGRYFLVKGQLWRCSNHAFSEEERQHLVHDLMDARRSIFDRSPLELLFQMANEDGATLELASISYFRRVMIVCSARLDAEHEPLRRTFHRGTKIGSETACPQLPTPELIDWPGQIYPVLSGSRSR